MRSGAETKVGIITVLALLLLAGYLFYVRGYRAAADTYTICVTFDNARGLQRGDPVRMVGVKIGEVTSVEVSPELRADVTLSVSRRYALYDNYRFQIATSGIIQERFVEVVPERPTPGAVRMDDGSCVEGVLQPTLSDLVAAGGEVLDNLNRTSRALNVVLTDQEILTGLRSALHGFSAAARAASELATATAALADESRPEIMAALSNLEGASADLQVAAARFRSRVAEGGTLDDLEQTAAYAKETAANAARASAAVAALADDAEVQQQLRDTLAAIHDAALSAKQVGDDLKLVSAELREAAPVIPRVAEEAEQMAGTSQAIRERLQPPEVDAAFDVAYSGEADRWFPSVRFDFDSQENRFFRLGLDDIGEENDVNAQIGDRYERATLRYGLMRSRLGLGVDFDLPRRSVLSLDLFDPNNPRADILADVPVFAGRAEWSVLLGARDVGDEGLLVAGIRLKR
jgi:phospholipid/cholesterol/gamma-HCH transport system substrate-binding protein